MKKLLREYRGFLKNEEDSLSLLMSFLFFILSLIANYYANVYASARSGNPVTDLILDNIPVVNMDTAFWAGTVLFVIFVAIVVLRRPHGIAFVAKTVALFVITRAFFITLTHIGPSPLDTLTAPSEIGRLFSLGSDLFFSGHTGLPYLFALIYWHNKYLRNIFILISIFAGIGVLLGHIHYSIDVASAYFITYGVFCIAIRIFKKDYGRMAH